MFLRNHAFVSVHSNQNSLLGRERSHKGDDCVVVNAKICLQCSEWPHCNVVQPNCLYAAVQVIFRWPESATEVLGLNSLTQGNLFVMHNPLNVKENHQLLLLVGLNQINLKLLLCSLSWNLAHVLQVTTVLSSSESVKYVKTSDNVFGSLVNRCSSFVSWLWQQLAAFVYLLRLLRFPLFTGKLQINFKRGYCHLPIRMRGSCACYVNRSNLAFYTLFL